jgi:hypothetical protein
MNNSTFNGRVIHVGVWNKELSAAEVQELYREMIECPECGVQHGRGRHPNDGCRMGTVDNVMES